MTILRSILKCLTTLQNVDKYSTVFLLHSEISLTFICLLFIHPLDWAEQFLLFLLFYFLNKAVQGSKLELQKNTKR